MTVYIYIYVYTNIMVTYFSKFLNSNPAGSMLLPARFQATEWQSTVDLSYSKEFQEGVIGAIRRE